MNYVSVSNTGKVRRHRELSYSAIAAMIGAGFTILRLRVNSAVGSFAIGSVAVLELDDSANETEVKE